MLRGLWYDEYPEYVLLKSWPDIPQAVRKTYEARAAAALLIARPAIIEECAREAETQFSGDSGWPFRTAAKVVVGAIRALAEKP